MPRRLRRGGTRYDTGAPSGGGEPVETRWAPPAPAPADERGLSGHVYAWDMTVW